MPASKSALIALATPIAAPHVPMRMKAAGTQQPIALPTLRWRPDFVRGTPILRESRPLAADKPDARFHENESPGVPFFLRPMKPPVHLTLELSGGVAVRLNDWLGQACRSPRRMTDELRS